MEFQKAPNVEIIESKKNVADYFSLAVATFGVGYLPFAPGTWGSLVGIVIYLLFQKLESAATVDFINSGRHSEQIFAWIYAINAGLFLSFCFLCIWTASRAARLLQTKDPQKVVADEVVGQIIIFFFVPSNISWILVVAGFLLFRLFDIWKPFPINTLENLPAGIGICADDVLAGVYGGICLAVIYALETTFL